MFFLRKTHTLTDKGIMSEFKVEFHVTDTELAGKSCGFKVIKVGLEHCLSMKKHDIREKWWYYSLHFVQNGSGILKANGKTHVLSKGTAFLLFADESYEYYPDRHDPWSYTWIDFSAENDVKDLLDACGFTKENPFVAVGDDTQLSDLFRLALSIYDANRYRQMAVSGCLLMIFSKMLQNNQTKNKSELSRSSRFIKFRSVLFFINSNYQLELSLEEISDSVCISDRRILALFSEFLGMSPMNYIGRFRVSTACRLLKETDEKISVISKEVGIQDEKYFMRLFKKWKGMTPKEYRNADVEEDSFDWIKKLNIDF